MPYKVCSNRYEQLQKGYREEDFGLMIFNPPPRSIHCKIATAKRTKKVERRWEYSRYEGYLPQMLSALSCSTLKKSVSITHKYASPSMKSRSTKFGV